MARSLNRVQLIGNLTRDPELRYTPNGTAVCSFGLATNRSWKTDSGEKHDEAEFHNIVAWNKLAELCSQFLVKGRKVYVEGRLATRTWTAADGAQRNRTEIVISDMILLDSNRPAATTAPAPSGVAPSEPAETSVMQSSSTKSSADAKVMADKPEGQGKTEAQKSAKKAKSEEPTAASAKGHSTLRDEPSGHSTVSSDSKSSGPLRQSASEASEPTEEVVPDDIPF